MLTFRLLGTTVVLSAAMATSAATQQVMSEPAYCAFFYPYANCQNKGPGNPYTDPNYRRGPIQTDRAWSSDMTVGIAPKRSRIHRSDSAATRNR
jgi:hypothetical protein